MKKWIFLFFSVFLVALAYYGILNWNDSREELYENKTEVKFLIPDLSNLPPEILQALKSGKENDQILKRGFVVQDYLPVTRKNIFEISRSLTEAGISFSNPAQIDLFLMPGKAQEIRFMRKCIKEKGEIHEIYQITIQGRGGVTNLKMATPETLSILQMDMIREIFKKFNSEVNDRIYKAYFEIRLKDPAGNFVYDSENQPRTIEIDLFIKHSDGKLRLLFADGEIKFNEQPTQKAVALATTFRTSRTKHPDYLGLDVTTRPSFKARNIAFAGIPKDIQSYISEHSTTNDTLVEEIVDQYSQWTTPELFHLIFSPPSDHLGVYLNKKVLLNAESFGFGPSAAIGEIFPYLRNRIDYLCYIGTGHTLDLQRQLPYDAVFDCGAVTSEERKEKFLAIAKNFDIFITASDFETARLAKELGLELIIYDPLTWYWKEIPPIVQEADFYVAQNFFGVAERLQKEKGFFPEHSIVPAIISGIHDTNSSMQQNNLLVNMGGLSNPYTAPDDLGNFAKIVFGFSQAILESAFDHTTYVSSQSIVKAIQPICPTAQTLQPQEVQSCLSNSALAIMTSGLGNLYEASSMNKRVIWLPPANDSQGQQITLLKKYGMADYAIDWADIFVKEAPVDYFGDQKEVMQQIASYMRRLAIEPQAKTRFVNLLCEYYERSKKGDSPALGNLANKFEIDGAKQAADTILEYLKP